jgi:hypothetical protein
MPTPNGKTVVCVDCPIESGDNRLSQFMCEWRNKKGGLYHQIQNKGFRTALLPQLTLDCLEAAVSDPSVAFLTASGHGSSDGVAFVAELGRDLLHSHLYHRTKFNRKIVHLFACDTAKNLGHDLVGPALDGTGVSAFFGYDADFCFAQEYNEDFDAAGMFIDCDSAMDLALADGATAQQAFAKGVKAFNDLIDRWKLEPSKAILADLLRQDVNALSLGIRDGATAVWKTGITG